MSAPREKIALITGATSGIGKALAIRLAEDGYTLVLVGRNVERGKTVQKTAREMGVDAHFMTADLSLMSEVKQLAETFRQQHDHLDLLVHSAGIILTGRELTHEGLEATFATDYLSRFYLTELLMNELRASPAARIVNIAAAGSGMGTLHFDDLLGDRKIGGMRGLGQAQFANDVHTIELARRLRDTSVTVNVMHPGAVDTAIRRELPGWLNGLMRLLMFWAVMSADEGAEAPYYLATSPEVAGISGGLFKQKEQITPSEKTADPTLGKRLWQTSEQLIQEVMGVTV